jgi:serine/threonine-protein kinase
MAKKTVADAAKAKAAKQKKMAIGLSVFLVLAMGYAVHTMMSLKSGGGPSSKPVAGTTATASPSAPTAAPTGSSALPAAPTLSGAATPTASSSSSPTSTTPESSSSLIAAVKPPAGTGQLQSFSLFESKDPFNASGPASPASGGSSSGGGKSSGGSSSGGGTPTTPKTPPAPPTAPPTSAVIAVNGVSESVTSGAAFPAANPMFQLVSLTNGSAKVSVVGGSYASGSQTLTIKVGKPVTLVNTADGTRYTVELMPQGTVATSSGSSTASGSSTTPTTTTPTG